MNKTSGFTLTAVICLLFFSSMAYAQYMGPGMMGRGMMGSGYGIGPGMMSAQGPRMSPEQQKDLAQMRTKFLKDTLELRQKLITKEMELQTLWQEKNPDPDKVKVLSNDVSDLQARLLKQRNEYLIQCRNKFGDQNWACPGGDTTGLGMMGTGMMGGMMEGYGMMPGMMYNGMMHRGWGPYHSDFGYTARPDEPPLKKQEAKNFVENYLKSTHNPNLVLGKIAEKGDDFVVDICTKEGSVADKVLVDKYTGWMRSAYTG